MFVWGGSDGQDCFSDLFMLDVGTGTWLSRPVSSSIPGFGHSSSMIGSSYTALIFGGHTSETYTNELKMLNIDPRVEVSEVVVKPSSGIAPCARGYHSSLYYDSRLFVFGGYDGDKSFNDTNILDLGIYASTESTQHK